jgi:hypothetical protein
MLTQYTASPCTSTRSHAPEFPLRLRGRTNKLRVDPFSEEAKLSRWILAVACNLETWLSHPLYVSRCLEGSEYL